MPSAPEASVVITTRNRREEIHRAVRSCLAQTGCSVEVIVFDDASTDGTTSSLRGAYPEIEVYRQEESTGYISLRNQGFEQAKGQYVFSIDDDAYFSTATIIRDTLRTLEDNPEAAAVAIPYLEPIKERGSSVPMQETAPGEPVRSYVGCAHAIRRGLALNVGGYRPLYVHQGEERDLCIRLQDQGYKILYGTSDPIVHLYSPKRDNQRVNRYGYRNTLLFTALNAPSAYVPFRIGIDILQLLAYKFSVTSLVPKSRYLLEGLTDSLRYHNRRDPVSVEAYKSFRSLHGHGPASFMKRTNLPEPAQ